jgi:CubicO group peptidase (beta-lactamase class C family)
MGKSRLAVWGAAALAYAAPAPAAELSERDRVAIAAVEERLPARPGPDPVKPSPKLAERMAALKVPAVSIAYFENGQVRWARAYGRAAAREERRVTPETRFQAASMSKAVTAAGALRLVDQGRLALDEDVNARLRAWRVPDGAPEANAQEVTLRRLLSHTAGLSVDGYPGYSPGTSVPTLVQSLRGEPPSNTPAVRLVDAPGTKFSYSGGGYSVAQLLMTETAGTDFARLIRRSVLDPVGMTRSSFEQPLSPDARRAAAAGHDADGRTVPGGGHLYPEQAAAGLWTTPTEYARFLIALQRSWAGESGALLKPESAKAMMTPVLGASGLGVNVIRRGERTLRRARGQQRGLPLPVRHVPGRRARGRGRDDQRRERGHAPRRRSPGDREELRLGVRASTPRGRPGRGLRSQTGADGRTRQQP